MASTSSGQSTASSSSPSPWWRFWRERSPSASSSSADEDDDDDDDDDYHQQQHPQDQPQPSEFTLITPSLQTQHDYPHPSNHDQQTPPPYDAFTSSDITPALQRLLAYWNTTTQQDPLPADLGLQQLSQQHQTTTTTNIPPAKEPIEHEKPSFRLLPKVRKQPLNPMHKLLFNNDGRLFLLESPTPTLPTKNTPTPRPSPPPSPTPSGPASSSPPADNTPPQPSAWWLDITCPTSADMHQLRKIFPLHPLTIEDILHQDTREKTETFHSLGYYLICFRGLDESSFKYKDDDEDEDDEDEDEDEQEQAQELERVEQREAREEEKAGADSGKTTSLKTRTLNSSKDGIMLSSIIRRRKNGAGRPGAARRRRKPNKIVQTTADHSLNKTLDGVGVGAVNMYLVVFRDGIISFHFENLQKHIDRVKERIHSFSTDTGHVSPHWIAYGLMDSIVDEFFPVLELIEAETDKMEEYLLADPLGLKMQEGRGVGERRRRRRGRRGRAKGGGGSNSSETGGGSAGAAERLKSDAMIERARMLTRITTNRRLVVSLARLIAQKHQTVEALRKRMSVDGFVGPTGGGGARAGEPEGRSMEIGLYLGDLQDHIVGLSQALSFYDTLLSNAHSAYLGILRVGLHSAKQAQDVIIIRLYLITLIVLPMNTLIGLHSMNIHIPANGDMENHRLADGSQAPFTVFAIVILGCLLIGIAFVAFIWKVIFAQSALSFNRPVPKLFYFL